MSNRETAPCIVAESIEPAVNDVKRAGIPGAEQLESVKERMLGTYGDDFECPGVVCTEFERCVELGKFISMTIERFPARD